MVLIANNITTNTTNMDFTNSAQSDKNLATQLLINDVLISNAIEWTEWDASSVQMMICEECGYVHCRGGGYVSFRKAGQYILMIEPCLEMFDGNDFDDQYTPPSYITVCGAIILNTEQYETIRQLQKGQYNPNFPKLNDVPSLSAKEALLLMQRLAINEELGKFHYAPLKFLRKNVIATSHENDEEAYQALEELILKLSGYDGEFRIKPIPNHEKAIDFFVYDGDINEWSPITKINNEWFPAIGKSHYLDFNE